jgi:hypothetical protein
MVKIIRLIVLTSCILFINALVLSAQVRKEPLPLSELLVMLQTKHNVQFNYAEDIIVGILLEPPPENLTLQETLVYLQENTNLSFTVLNGNLIILTPKESLVLGIG